MTQFRTAHLHDIIFFLDDVLQVLRSPPVSTTAMVLRSMEKMSLDGREEKEGEQGKEYSEAVKAMKQTADILIHLYEMWPAQLELQHCSTIPRCVKDWF
jgi:hypothetical protein